MRRRIYHLLVLPALLCAAYGLGFAWFLRLTGAVPDLPARAGAIVVLTGGPGRIETGLRLLAAGHADALLISGLGGRVTLDDLARRAGVDPAVLAGRVSLGRRATTTRTNALETADFAAAHRLGSLIVVTAAFHTPRALVELGRAMPGVALHPAPVPPAFLPAASDAPASDAPASNAPASNAPASNALGRGAARAPSWRQLLEEYTKFLVALAGLSGYGPAHADVPVGVQVGT